MTQSMFHDVLFPLPLSFGSTGGPVRRTEIARLASGREVRNTPAQGSQRRYSLGAAIKSETDARTLLHFFEARRGPLHGFRFRDPIDHSLGNETIGIGDGVTTEFQMTKSYGDVAGQSVRVITKPSEMSIKIDGTELPGSDFSIDHLTGVLSCTTAPANGASISVSGIFDVPVRFESDRLDLSLESFGAFNIPSIDLVEIIDA